MEKVNVTKTINVSAQAAWKTLSSFRDIENFSPIARSVVTGEGEGAKRVCYMPDNAEINEVLSVVDNSNMEFQYKIITGPFPVTNYLSTVRVKEVSENSCEVSWGSQYETSEENAAAMKELFAGFYNVIIDSLPEYISSLN